MERRPFDAATTPWHRDEGLATLIARWRDEGRWRHVVFEEKREARQASMANFPAGLDERIVGALKARGLNSLYSHQAHAYRSIRDGKHIVVATPTASGKSLCYTLPILQSLCESKTATALCLFPTKALGRDQEAAFRELIQSVGIENGCITYDGDTPGDARRVARQKGSIVCTNPDMLHSGIMPHHPSWARFFAGLKYIVIDEVHTYRGVFGSHLAHVLRRLFRIARFHGAEPQVICASATIGNPQEHASAIVGADVELIAESGAPTGPRTIAIYNPPVINEELGLRASYVKTTVKLAAELTAANVPTLIFGQSRNSVEVMLKYLRDAMRKQGLDANQVFAYRGGYLPQQRREIEKKMRAGEIKCIVATNALELGIDIGALEAVICAGYPGSVAALWQRFGRAGRRNKRALNILVTSSLALDQYVARSADSMLGRQAEQAQIDPQNIEILLQHLKCAAFELPFREDDRYGALKPSDLLESLAYLVDVGLLHQGADGDGKKLYRWMSESYPANHVSLRMIGWDNFVVIDLDGDKTIAEMDWRSTHTMLHEQAIYQHDGRQYQVEKLDYENHKAYVRQVKPDYYTTAMKHTKVTPLELDEQAHDGPSLQSNFGEVTIIQKVVGYKKIKYHSHENVGYGEVDLPEMQMHTTSYWATLDAELIAEWMKECRVDRAAASGILQGVLNAMHTVAVSGLMIDPRDVGRSLELPSERTAEAFEPSLFLYDSVPGGIGLAKRMHESRADMWRRTRQAIETCQCQSGCPSCVGPLDGNVVESSKSKALILLEKLGIAALH